jgi:hypothetical protein
MEHTRDQCALVVHDSTMEFFDRQKHSKAFLAKSLRAKHESESDQSRSSDQFKRFYLGQRVRLCNLSRSELNNTEGVVIEPESDGRVAISLKKASPEVLQRHSDGIRVKWENIEWLNRRPIHEIILHYAVYIDEETGQTLTQAESETKVHSFIRAQQSGRRSELIPKIPSHVRMINADLRTNTDHMAQSESLEFMQNHIGKLRNAYYSFTGHGPPVNMVDAECLSLYETLFADMRQHSPIWNNFFENIKN